MFDSCLDESKQILTLTWNNRAQKGGSGCLLTILVGAWLGTLIICGVSIWALATERNSGPDILMYFVITISAVFIFILPLRILNRFTSEQVVFTAAQYRFACVEYPWLFPTSWPVNSITRVTIGHHANAQGDRETIVTLNVFRGWRRSIIGYWLSNDDKDRLYRHIADFFQRIGRDIPFEETYDEDFLRNRDTEV